MQAERFSEDYHGTHAKPARPVPLDWHEATGRMEAARVLAHTCECRPVLPELCSRGGGDLIRRDRHRLEGRVPVRARGEHLGSRSGGWGTGECRPRYDRSSCESEAMSSGERRCGIVR